MARHMGKDMKGEPLVVSYMMLPNSPEPKALVTRPGRLDQNLQRTLMSLVGSPEAQSTRDLADVLGRRMYHDSGKTMFQVLHEIKALEAVSIDDVVMTPQGNTSYPLRTILEQMGAIRSPVTEQRQAEGFNPHANNQQAEANDEVTGLARNLLIEAEMLEEDARAKRERAFSMAPQLRPQPTPVAAPEVAEPAISEADLTTQGFDPRVVESSETGEDDGSED